MKSNQKILLEIFTLVLGIAGIALLAQMSGKVPRPRQVQDLAEGQSSVHQSSEHAVNGFFEKVPAPSNDEVSDSRASAQLDSISTREVASSPYPGFTLYATSGTAEIVLANLKGEFVKRWDIDADRARLLPNCNLLVVHGSKWGLEREPWASLRSVVREYTWDGEVAWEVELPGDAHHDVTKLSNGNTLILYLTQVPEAVVKKQLRNKFSKLHVRSDVLAEFTPEGKEVWRWQAHDHIPLNDCGAKKCPNLSDEAYLSGKRRFDWTHINTVREIPQNRWAEAGDTRFIPGNIIVFPRNFWSSLVIEKTSGQIVWKYHGEYRGGLSGGHESYMIGPGLPGAGNVLIFDNGRVHEQSAVLEVNPQTKKIVWKYQDGAKFFSRVAGSAQRLANGNTLISEDTSGRVFEVNSEGKQVWSHQAYKHRINRAHRYDVGFCPKLTADLL